MWTQAQIKIAQQSTHYSSTLSSDSKSCFPRNLTPDYNMQCWIPEYSGPMMVSGPILIPSHLSWQEGNMTLAIRSQPMSFECWPKCWPKNLEPEPPTSQRRSERNESTSFRCNRFGQHYQTLPTPSFSLIKWPERQLLNTSQYDHYTELQIPMSNLATSMHLNLDNWYHKLNVSKTELKIHPQPTLLLPRTLSMALFLLTSAPSPKPQQTSLSLSLKYAHFSALPLPPP